MKIALVDYSIGNVKSIVNAMSGLGCKTVVTNLQKDLAEADALILAGVGNFSEGRLEIQRNKLDEILGKLVLEEKKPILGICLGMQLMTNGSEESDLPGLGWLPCSTRKIPNQKDLKIPNIGWSGVDQSRIDAFTEGLSSKSRFYFTHSYAILEAPEEYVTLKTKYGRNFVAAVRKENIFGVQFHPEKSYHDGEIILRNFLELV